MLKALLYLVRMSRHIKVVSEVKLYDPTLYFDDFSV